ncbi:MAG TPA: PAS domain S-box protein [Candidatus Acidoferrum sp.]|nr:PAS domain S-box protein [Candidatus Acidoferrum sp.]
MNKTARILLVDDEPEILKVFTAFLHGAGYEVLAATTGQQGLQLAREKRPELVLLDVLLPDVSGLEICRQIKGDPDLRDVYVLLISGGATKTGHKVEGLEAGADDYLIKPPDPDELLARIRTQLRLREAMVALRASEEHHRRLMDILPDAVCVINPRGRLLAVNTHAVSRLGYASREELLQKSIFDLTPKEEHDRISADLAAILQAGTRRNLQYTLLDRNGARLQVEVNATVSLDNHGQLAGLVVVGRDVTARKEVEAALRQSQERYRSLAESSPDAIFIVDRDSNLQYLNEAAAAWLGKSDTELLGRPQVELLPSPKAHQQPGLVQKIFATGELVCTLQNESFRGAEKWIETRLVPLRNELGQVVQVMGIARDLTEQKRAEESLREREEWSRRIIGTALDGFWMLDLEGRIVDVNDAYCRMSGYTRGELLSKHVSEVEVNEPSPAQVSEHMQRIRQASGDHFETRHRCKDGRIIELEVSATYLRLREQRIFAFFRDITQRKQTERELRASEERFRQLADNIRGVFWMSNPDKSQIIYVSPAYEQIWGRTCASLNASPRDWVEAIHPEDRPRVLDAALTKQVSGQYDEVYRIVRPDGSTRWIQDRAFPVRDSAGTVYRLVGIAEDITPWKEAEEALRVAETRYRSIFEHATEGIFRTTLDGKIVVANPALARMFGYASPQEMVSAVHDIARQIYVSPQRRAEMIRLLSEHGSVQGFEEENYRKDGSVIWVSLNAHVVCDAGGAVQYFEGTIQDITERKRAETQLATLGHAVQSTAELICITDLQDRFTFVNRAFLQAYGYTEAEILGKTPDILISPNNPPGRMREILEMARTTGWRGEVMDRRKDGTEFPIFLSTSKIVDLEGRPIGLMGVSQDITERKWAENLLQTQRDFGTFLSSTIDLNATAVRLLEIALLHEGVDCGGIFMVDPETRALGLLVHRGCSADFAERVARAVAEPAPARPPGRSREPEAPTMESLAAILARLKPDDFSAMEVFPIQQSGELVAVLIVGSHAQAEIPRRTRQALELITAQAAGAVARIRVEQSLRANRRLLERTLHSIPAAVFVVNADTNIIEECNPATAQMFGYAHEELIGQPLASLHVSEAAAEQFASHRFVAVEDKGFLNNFEFKLRRKDGAEFPAEHSVMPIRNELGRLVSWVNVVQDITQRKQDEEGLRQLPRRVIEAQESERLRVAREIHDGVNQVIASVKMRLHQLEGQIGAMNPAAREILGRCEKLLGGALEENRRIAHNLRPADLDELGLAAACRNYCREIQSRTGLTVRYSIANLSRRLPPAVELNLFRIVQEALTNVEQHARAKTVRVRLHAQGDDVILRIKDDGQGGLSRPARAGRAKWRGIGLTNMRERALALGGTCEVLLTPQQGTTITVRIPGSQKA